MTPHKPVGCLVILLVALLLATIGSCVVLTSPRYGSVLCPSTTTP